MRSDILATLRPQIRDLLLDVETITGLEVQFEPLQDSHVIAQYTFDPQTNTPTVSLGSKWEDVDVAHELMHMRLELVEGYYVLAWRHGVARLRETEAAFSWVRKYVDDEVVHARLAEQGYQVDGEVLKPQLFDDIYTRVPRYLRKRRPYQDDGMAHLDRYGYGDLCRSAFLVGAELVLQSYGGSLPSDRLKRVKRFIKEFRIYRGEEAKKADKILALFRQNDVQSVDGHKEILREWAGLEGLDQFVGISAYRSESGGFILPCP
jgi:hypothetical protein